MYKLLIIIYVFSIFVICTIFYTNNNNIINNINKKKVIPCADRYIISNNNLLPATAFQTCSTTDVASNVSLKSSC